MVIILYLCTRDPNGYHPIIAQLLGAKKTDSIPTIVYQGFYIATTPSTYYIINRCFRISTLLNFLNLEPAATAVCINYLKAFALGLFPLLWVNTLRNTVDSHGLTHYSMAIVVTSFVVNVFLSTH